MNILDRILYFAHRKLRRSEHTWILLQLKYVGKDTKIDERVFVWTPSRVSIGSRAQINGYSFIYGGGGIDIGDDVMIGANCVISSVTHPTDRDRRREISTNPVEIHQNVWIGAGVIVLPGVTIGENSIVAAGSVVRTSIPANVMAAGVPAVVKRPLDAPQIPTPALGDLPETHL